MTTKRRRLTDERATVRAHPTEHARSVGDERSTDVSLDDVRSVFASGEPMITAEIEARFDLRHRAALDKLEQLHERGELERKRIGTRLAVWWRVDG